MSESRLPPLATLQGWEDLADRLRGILEAQAPIREALFAFESLYGLDDQRAAQCLALLQVRVFTGLATLVRRTMRPYIYINREICSRLEGGSADDEGPPSIDVSSATRPNDTKETMLPRLKGIGGLSGFSYHACGIIDALDDVREAADAFVAACGVDDEKATTALADLQVQLFFHLAYHIRKLKRFLIRLNREIYAKLDEELEFEEA